MIPIDRGVYFIFTNHGRDEFLKRYLAFRNAGLRAMRLSPDQAVSEQGILIPRQRIGLMVLLEQDGDIDRYWKIITSTEEQPQA